jgi:hypothetical protein
MKNLIIVGSIGIICFWTGYNIAEKKSSASVFGCESAAIDIHDLLLKCEQELSLKTVEFEVLQQELEDYIIEEEESF